GGAVATEYALRHPDEISHLVLIGVPMRFVLQPGTRPLLSTPGPLFDTLVKRLNIALFAHPFTLRRMHDGAMTNWPGEKRLAQLQTPTLVVLGQRDTVFTRDYYEGVTKAIPGAKQVVIPVSAHLVQLERAEATNRAIRRFLDPRPPTESGGNFPSPLGRANPARYVTMPWLQSYDPDVPEHIPLPRMLLHDLLSNAAGDFPDRPALIFFGQQISYRELDTSSNRFAHALRGLGVGKGDRVAVVLPNTPQCVIAFYGALKAGAVVVLGSPLSSEQEIAAQVKDAGARVLLTLASYRSLAERVAQAGVEHVILTDVREYLPLRQRLAIASLIDGQMPHTALAASAPDAPTHTEPSASESSSPRAAQAPTEQANGAASLRASPTSSFQQLLRAQPTTPLDSGATGDDLALLQYTSGTTDTPRGVMLTHGNLVVNVTQTRHWLSDARRGKEVLLCVMPLAHSYGITSGLNLTVAIAGTLVLLPTTRIDQILRAIKRYHPSLFPGVPALYVAIANYPRVRSYGVASIRICVSGSAPLPIEAQEAFEKLTRGRLVEGYGLTEASPVTHSNPIHGERRVGSIGLPYPNTDARIVDVKTGQPLAPGEVGELLIKGPQVMRGYWNRPEDTAQALADGWLHTGDLARMDEDGFFTIVDRKRDVILAGAYNVYPRDVEEVLYEHPKVLEAAVVSATTRATGDGQTPLIKAVVVLKRGERATADELLALCRERLDAYKVPRQIEFRTELPKNFVGKVLRRLLVEG
ncbi:MAG TPA: AMP-binding protein, partial [Ktedonobacterales bacterium]|nr:AMP-binding protein [Ktedonobacterales bacterium]